MKKIITLFIYIILSTTLLAQKTSDIGVEINGITWATSNVDASGTFAQKPEDAGKLYQWNRSVAYSINGSGRHQS